MELFCKHNWAVIHEHTTASRVEVAAESGIPIPKKTLRGEYGFQNWNRTYFVSLACTKCGKLNRTRERN